MTFDRDRWNAAIDETNEWSRHELRLERPNNGSVLHQLLEAWHKGELIEGENAGFDAVAHFKRLLDHEFQTFVVEHDWAAAFINSDLDLGDDHSAFPQPYDHCVFEFAISGKRVCLISSLEDESYYRVAALVRLQAGWFQIPLEDDHHSRSHQWRKFLFSQQRAISVALDAAVARTEILRAPHALNRSRAKRGKLPVFDYHIIQIAHRTKPAELPPDNESSRNSPRLHFRRGHWRHFEAFKTWINWMLVGDPNLGWIDKHYRL